MTEDIFDMSNVRMFKEIEMKKWRMFILCYVFGHLSGLRNLCYSKIPVVMLLGYMIAGISQKLELEQKNALRPNVVYLYS